MKVYLGSIVYREVSVAHYSAMMALLKFCHQNGIETEEGIVRGDALVERSRSIAASAFLRSDCDVMLSIDADIYFRPIDAIALCQKALDKQVIGGLYMTRNLNTQPAMMLPADQEVRFLPDAEPVEVPYISTGFMAVTKAPLEALTKTLPLCHQTWGETAFWPFYMVGLKEWPEDGHILLSEDWAFCERAREAGFPPYLDPSVRLVHYGDYPYSLEDLLQRKTHESLPLVLERHSDGTLDTRVLKEAMT